MIKIKEIIQELIFLFPKENAEKWDKIGLQYGKENQEVNKVLVSLDLTTKVLKLAIKENIDLIIVHHPFIWEDTLEEMFQNAPYKRNIHNKLKQLNIGLYSLHTNYDSHVKGSAFQIFKKLGFKKSKLIQEVKYGRFINENLDLKEIQELFKNNFNFFTFNFYESISNVKYKKISILPGSGDIKDIINCKKKGMDLIISSDIKWSSWITIKEMNINVLEVSHEVENVFSKDVCSIVSNKFKKIKVLYI